MSWLSLYRLKFFLGGLIFFAQEEERQERERVEAEAKAKKMEEERQKKVWKKIGGICERDFYIVE